MKKMKNWMIIVLLMAVMASLAPAAAVRAGEPAEAARETTQEDEEEPIAAPKLKKARASEGKITVTWKKVKNARTYVIYRKLSSAKKFKKLGSVKAADSAKYIDRTVKPGTAYTYTVRAVGKIDGKKVNSKWDKKGVSAVAKVPRVTMVSGTLEEKSSILVWEEVADVTGYYLYRKTDSGSYSKLANITGASTVRYRDKKIKIGHSYTYRVRAYVKSGSKTYMSSAGTSTVTVDNPLAAPAIRQVAQGAGKLRIEWDVVPEAAGYIIYRKTGADGSYKKIFTKAKKLQNYYWDRTTSAGTEYTYAIAAFVKEGSKKIYSERTIQEGSSICLPGTPFISSVVRDGEDDIVSWVAPPKADGYIVYRQLPSSDRMTEVQRVGGDVTELRVSREEEGVSTYAVRAWVTVNGDNSYRSPYLDKVTNEVHSYYKQKVLFAGDSITYGYLTTGVRTPIPYPERVKWITGINYQNLSYNGSSVARYQAGGNSLVERVQNGTISFEGYSVIWIAQGTNDYAYSVEIGKIGDESEDTFYGAMNIVLQAIRKQNPEAKVVLMTPLYRGRYNSDWSKKGYYYFNNAGYALVDYCVALKKIAVKYFGEEAVKYNIFDSEQLGIVTEANSTAMLCDGLHPTEETYATLAKAVSAFLVENSMTPDTGVRKSRR